MKSGYCTKATVVRGIISTKNSSQRAPTLAAPPQPSHAGILYILYVVLLNHTNILLISYISISAVHVVLTYDIPLFYIIIVIVSFEKFSLYCSNSTKCGWKATWEKFGLFIRLN